MKSEGIITLVCSINIERGCLLLLAAVGARTCTTPWPMEKGSCEPRAAAVFSSSRLMEAGLKATPPAFSAERRRAGGGGEEVSVS